MFAQNRELFDDQADIAVGFKHFGDFGMRLAAVPAAVVYEFYQCDIAVRITADIRISIVEQGFGVVSDQTQISLRSLLLLACFELVDGFHDHLGLVHQVGADFFAEDGAFFIAHVCEIEC